MFDITDKEGTLTGGSLKLIIKMSVINYDLKRATYKQFFLKMVQLEKIFNKLVMGLSSFPEERDLLKLNSH